MSRAEEVCGSSRSWAQCGAHLQDGLQYGYEHERGGLYSRGLDDQPATQTDKVWWVQAEMLAALTVEMGHRPSAASAGALEKLLRFISKYQADPAHGIWLDTVDAEGRPKATGQAH